uniref:Uncharacterized protein n=1 Tax=Setaria digitata TaxID=48799 RepID=A0A915Q3R7_9BILA
MTSEEEFKNEQPKACKIREGGVEYRAFSWSTPPSLSIKGAKFGTEVIRSVESRPLSQSRMFPNPGGAVTSVVSSALCCLLTSHITDSMQRHVPAPCPGYLSRIFQPCHNTLVPALQPYGVVFHGRADLCVAHRKNYSLHGYSSFQTRS